MQDEHRQTAGDSLDTENCGCEFPKRSQDLTSVSRAFLQQPNSHRTRNCRNKQDSQLNKRKCVFDKHFQEIKALQTHYKQDNLLSFCNIIDVRQLEQDRPRNAPLGQPAQSQKHMRKLIFSLIFISLGPVNENAVAQGYDSNHPAKQVLLPSGIEYHGPGNMCYGRGKSRFTYPDGTRLVTDSCSPSDNTPYGDKTPYGDGILYDVDGNVQQRGWFDSNGRFARFSPFPNESTHPFIFTDSDRKRAAERAQAVAAEKAKKLVEDRERERLQSLLTKNVGSSQVAAHWKDRLDSAVQSFLRAWLAPVAENLAEIQPPTYPPGISLKQEAWDSNKEFEDRVESLRNERRIAIEALEADYRSKVEARNRRVAAYNKLVQDRQTGLSAKRRELTLVGLQILNLSVKIFDIGFDQQTGAVSITAEVQGLDKLSFSFASTAPTFRKTALTQAASLRAWPEFHISDSGAITLSSLVVHAGGEVARGIPSLGVASSVQLATATIPQVVPSTVAQQSPLTVDKNQVEQILYRDENESLRKRLEEQRKQQEQAVASAEAKAAAEITRLRAEADALRKQPNTKPPMNYASVQDAHALVIGNSAYSGSNRLANPANDAKAMSAKLRSLGFKVTEIANASRDQMVAGLSEFSKTAAKADLSVLFYAGHGIQIAGTNYMIPVDMRLNDTSQATLQAVSLTQVVEQYLPGKTKLVFLDACRDNPLVTSGSRGFSKGLAPISVSEGTLIAYATKDGQTADDGIGQVNSPFTSALLEHLADPDDIAVVLRTVRAKVMTRTNNRQQPWEYGSLTGGALVLSAIKK
jgi:hypothetical protein